MSYRLEAFSGVGVDEALISRLSGGAPPPDRINEVARSRVLWAGRDLSPSGAVRGFPDRVWPTGGRRGGASAVGGPVGATGAGLPVWLAASSA